MSMARIPTSLRSISSSQPSLLDPLPLWPPAGVRTLHSQSHTERVKAWALLWPGATPALDLAYRREEDDGIGWVDDAGSICS